MRKRKILRFFGIALLVILGVLVFLSITGTVAHAAGLVDNTVSDANAYSKYPLENYQLQDLNVDTVRQDIPTSSTVTDVKIWDIEQAGTDDFTVVYSVDQTVTEGGNLNRLHFRLYGGGSCR